ncbi:hypothetical protein [Cohnella caldifontis]|uniref:hypothetical protein n=1 Tax=Cohnella caldifontis TaxID=3027471 RepID=UPI0023EC087E|nr:hypothetical protein [Cohnella sp. YIM B05605]
MNLHMLNVILPIVFLLYQIVIDFVDLFPFNDIRARDKRLRKFEVLGNYPPLILISACFYFEGAWARVGYAMTAIIMAMHLLAWWIPYWTGKPASVRQDYDKYFSRTYKFLPKIRDHIVPDAEHAGVGALLTVTLAVQSIYMFA